MVKDNGKSRISADFADYLKLAPLSQAAGKLLLALTHLQHLEEEGWPKTDLDEMGEAIYEGDGLQTHFAYVEQFRELGLATRSNDARLLIQGVKNLQDRPELFDELEYHTGAKGYLVWRFSYFAAAMMADMDRYALLHTTDLQHCSSELDIPLLTQIMLHHRMRRPEFSFLRVSPRAGFELPFAGQRFSDIGLLLPRLKRSLAKWARLKNLRFAVGLEQRGSRPGVTDIRIRIRHDRTIWTSQQFREFDRRTKMFEIGSA